MKWTTDQEKAIYSKGNTIVTAAAGSGKTAVLVERVISKLCDENNPVSADRLLIVTFTNAAAAEMRQRIEKALSDKCTEQPDNAYLLKQRLLISSADICTIDSFCIRLVRNNFSILGISPDFKIADEVTDSAIKLSVCKKIFNEYFEKNDLEFLEFLNISNSEYGTFNAEQNILEINSFCQKLPQGYNWLKKSAEKYNPSNLKDNEYINIILNDTYINLSNFLCELIEYRKDLITHEKTDLKYGSYFDALIEYAQKLVAASRINNWDECYNLLINTPEFIGRFAYSKNYDPILFERGSNLYKEVKGFILELVEKINKPLEELENDFAFSYRIILKIFEIVKEFGERYVETLNKKSLLTFAQVELLTLNLLTDENECGELIPSELSRELTLMYDEIMVDEYQDINDLQGTIFEILSDDCKKLFTVGDVKQSIYGFRGSNPEIFSKRSEAAQIFDSKIPSNNLKRIVLSNNFRSREEVCEFINSVFSSIMSKNSGAIDYNENEMLYPLAEFPNNNLPAVEAYLLSTEEDLTSTEAEAVFFADYIEKTINQDPFLRDKNGTLRKATYGDFALLLRSGVHLNEYLKELKTRNIPVSVGGGNFFDTTEILTAISLIKAVENPMDDISMLSVMLSPIFGFNEDEIAELKCKYKGRKLYSGILNEAKNNSKFLFLKEKIILWRSFASCNSTADFISTLLIDSGYNNMVLSMSDSQRRESNLYFLEQLAEAYFLETSGDLTGFIKYLKYLKSLDNTPSATVVEGNSVSISTMHRSKGLQYPITVLGSLSSRFSNLDITKDFLLSEKLGIAFKYIDETENVKQNNFAVSIFKSELRKKQLEEEMRLFYVAMTRAEERLVMLINVSNKFITKLNDNVLEIENIFEENGTMKSSAVMEATSYSDWLIPILLQTPKGLEFLKENGEELHKISPKLHGINASVFYKQVSPISVSCDKKTPIQIELDEKLKNELLDVFNFEYPFKELNDIEVKTSVSQLTKRKADREFSITSRPAFLSSKGLSPTERGTALHKFMQYADFLRTEKNPEEEIERLYEFGYISRAEADVIDVKKIYDFTKTDLFKRILKCDKLYREQRFMLDVKAGDIYTNLSSMAKEQTVIVQGAVDCMFIEDDHIVLIDFKTDRTTNEDFLLAHYSEQLKTYSVAAQKMLSLPVTECYIYSLDMSKKIKVNLNK